MNYNVFTTFAATYNCDAYGMGTYDSQGVCTTQADSGDWLANTGVPVVLPLVGGILLIAVAIVLLVRKPRKKASR